MGPQAQSCSCTPFLFAPNSPSCFLTGWKSPHPLPLCPPPQQSINQLKWCNTQHALPPPPSLGFPKTCGPPFRYDWGKGGGGGMVRRLSSHLCPSAAIDPVNHHLCEKKPWAPARPAGSALPPLPRVASSLCSPPTPPCFKFCRYGSVQQPLPAGKGGREGEIGVELGFPSPPGAPRHHWPIPAGPALCAGNPPPATRRPPPPPGCWHIGKSAVPHVGTPGTSLTCPWVAAGWVSDGGWGTLVLLSTAWASVLSHQLP